MLRHPIRRISSILLAIVVVLASELISASLALAALPGTSPVLTRAPYLSDLTQTSVQVSWATSAQYTAVVEYGPPR